MRTRAGSAARAGTDAARQTARAAAVETRRIGFPPVVVGGEYMIRRDRRQEVFLTRAPAAASVSETVVARTFLGRWLRRGLLASFGVGFTVPYFAILNDVHVEGDEVLKELPRRNVVFLANHQTYFLEAIAFFDLVYVRHQMPLESPIVRFSAAEETMKQNLLTKLMTLAGGVTFRRSFREAGEDVRRAVDMEGVARVEE